MPIRAVLSRLRFRLVLLNFTVLAPMAGWVFHHAAGDLVLRELGRILITHTRGGDVAARAFPLHRADRRRYTRAA